jgi:hypothetical protein
MSSLTVWTVAVPRAQESVDRGRDVLVADQVELHQEKDGELCIAGLSDDPSAT